MRPTIYDRISMGFFMAFYHSLSERGHAVTFDGYMDEFFVWCGA